MDFWKDFLYSPHLDKIFFGFNQQQQMYQEFFSNVYRGGMISLTSNAYIWL